MDVRVGLLHGGRTNDPWSDTMTDLNRGDALKVFAGIASMAAGLSLLEERRPATHLPA